jgi:hypothetical protein
MTLAISDPHSNYRTYVPDNLQYRSVVDPLQRPGPIDGVASVSIYDKRYPARACDAEPHLKNFQVDVAKTVAAHVPNDLVARSFPHLAPAVDLMGPQSTRAS